MAVRSNSSRERILANAESIILQKGFGSTSIDDILQKSSITKGGFFYHFDGKPGLARALIERYIIQDEEIFMGLFRQADELSEDPLHRLLIFLKLLADMMSNMEKTHPGCLVASFTYENQQFNEEIRELMRQGIKSWQDMLRFRLEAIDQHYTRTIDIDNDTLAHMFSVIIEGGIILCRVYEDNQLLVDQILGYRSYLRMIYDVA